MRLSRALRAWAAFAGLARLALAAPAAATVLGAQSLALINPAPLPYYYPLGTHANNDIAWGTTTALGIGTSTKVTIAIWSKANDSADTGNIDNTILTSPSSLGRSVRTATACETSPDGICDVRDNSANKIRFSLGDNTGSGAGHEVGVDGVSGTAAWPVNLWNWLFITVDTGTQNWGIAQDGVDQTGIAYTLRAAIPANLAIDVSGAGFGTVNFGNGNTGVGEFEGVYVAKEFLGCYGAGNPYPDCTAANTVSQTAIKKFWRKGGQGANGGRALYLGDHGELPTGNHASIYATGNAAGMLTNKGDAAVSFSALAPTSGTTGGILTDAPYGPSGPIAGTVNLKWAQYRNLGSNGTSLSLSPGGLPMDAAGGELLVAAVSENDSSGTTNRAINCPSGWTCLGPKLGNTGSLNGQVAYKITGANDDGTVTFTWTGANNRFETWTLFNYGHVSSVEAGASSMTNPAAGTTASSPANTTSAAGGTIIAGVIVNDAGARTYGAPDVGTERRRVPHISNANQHLAADLVNVAGGASTKVQWALGSSTVWLGWAIYALP